MAEKKKVDLFLGHDPAYDDEVDKTIRRLIALKPGEKPDEALVSQAREVVQQLQETFGELYERGVALAEEWGSMASDCERLKSVFEPMMDSQIWVALAEVEGAAEQGWKEPLSDFSQYDGYELEETLDDDDEEDDDEEDE